jgi:hypothetical protein
VREKYCWLVADKPSEQGTDVCVFRTISYMQRWRILSREQAQRWIDLAIHKLRRRLYLLNSEG